LERRGSAARSWFLWKASSLGRTTRSGRRLLTPGALAIPGRHAVGRAPLPRDLRLGFWHRTLSTPPPSLPLRPRQPRPHQRKVPVAPLAWLSVAFLPGRRPRGSELAPFDGKS
ncbi:unnamed protein product, partial [Ectocarpus sp. 8 AP-2014]